MRDGRIIGWDFDGVLNRNVIDGRFIWADDFERDTGYSRDRFVEAVFARGFEDVVTGREDLLDRVGRWAAEVGYEAVPEAMLDYWFRKDALLDPDMMDIVERLGRAGVHQVIATNNEVRRASFIEKEMGLRGKVDRLFASGLMGIAKPAAGFFEHVTDALGADPAHMILIDDTLPNVEAAWLAGWDAIHFMPGTRKTLERRLLG